MRGVLLTLVSSSSNVPVHQKTTPSAKELWDDCEPVFCFFFLKEVPGIRKSAKILFRENDAPFDTLIKSDR